MRGHLPILSHSHERAVFFKAEHHTTEMTSKVTITSWVQMPSAQSLFMWSLVTLWVAQSDPSTQLCMVIAGRGQGQEGEKRQRKMPEMPFNCTKNKQIWGCVFEITVMSCGLGIRKWSALTLPSAES